MRNIILLIVLLISISIMPNAAHANWVVTEFSLINGDIDNDNYVGLSDYDIWAACYDTMLGEPGWNAMADLDGNGYIGGTDYDIWAANYDIMGD